MVGLLNSPPYGGGLLAPQQPSGLLGSIANFFRPWTPEDRAKVAAVMPPDLAPTQIVKGMVGGAANLAMQAHEAMPWGGNNPQAIGYDPQAGTIDPSVMIPFATDVTGMATTGSLAAPAVKNATGMGIRAYHGSPHDFDRFSMDKIGTGEGAQAYGHGLYFAENEGVAKGYRNSLAGNIAIDGKPMHVNNRKVGTTGDPELDDLIISYDGDIEAAIANADPYEAAKLEPFRGRVSAGNTGKMYEVDINASPDEFLDWDKPLSEQPAKVREALAPLVDEKLKEMQKARGGGPLADPANDLSEEAYLQTGMIAGEPLYRLLGDKAQSAEALRNAGVKGIRYRDAGSRGMDSAGGTSNFVVFDDNIIDILKKYGIAGLTAGGVGAAMLGGTQDASALPTSYSTGGRF